MHCLIVDSGVLQQTSERPTMWPDTTRRHQALVLVVARKRVVADGELFPADDHEMRALLRLCLGSDLLELNAIDGARWKMENNRLGLIGSSLLVAGLFAPIFTVTFGGKLNFIGGNPMFVSLSILALGCIGVFACARNEVSKIAWTGIGAMVLLLTSFTLAQYRFTQIQARFEAQIADNPFAQSARDSFKSPQTEWGWLVLAVGAALVIFASLNERKSAKLGALAMTDRIDKNYGLAASIASAIGLAMLGISHFNSAGPSPARSMADATEALAEDAAKGAATKAEASAIDNEKRDYIAKNLEVYKLEAKYMDSLLDGRIPGVTFKVRNKGQRTLEKVEVTVEFLDASGKAISEEVYNPVIAGGYSSDPPLRPDHIWQNERGQFLSAKSVPSEWQSGQARARVTDIEFATDESP